MMTTYIQYGISNELSEKLDMLGIPVSTFRATSKTNLIKRYGLSSDEIDLIKENANKRFGVSAEIVQT